MKGFVHEELRVPIEIPLGLRTALESGECVLFLGAGIGACAKDKQGQPAPDGDQLARDIATRFGLEAVEEGTLSQVAQLAAIRKGRRELETFLAERLRDLEPDETVLWLASLRWRAIFTTNYDALIQTAYSRLPSIRQNPVTISATSELTIPDPDLAVPIYHLHGSLFAGEKGGIVITEDDYSRFRERRRMLFAMLKLHFAASTILYVGYSHRDPNWRIVLEELREEFVSSDPPRAYRVARTTPPLDEEILRSRNVDTIPCSAAEFVASARAVLDEERLDSSSIEKLRAGIPSDLARKFDEAPAPVVRLLEAWTYVNQAPFDERPNLESFLKGDRPNWGLIARHEYFERDVESALYEIVLDCVTGSSRVAVILLLAPAGYGISTILMALAARLVQDKAGPVFVHRWGRKLAVGDILFAAGLTDSRPVFLVDNASDNKRELSEVIPRLRESNSSGIIVLGERINEWSQRPPKITGREYRVDPLTDAEIERLLELLEKHGALGRLTSLSGDLRMAAIREKHEKQLLVAMREATEGNSFDAIIEDEYRGIDEPIGQQLYAAVCCAFQIRSYIRDGVLAEVLGLTLPELYSRTRAAIEGVVEFDYVDERRGVYAARARHHVIAQVVWERCVPKEERTTLVERILAALNLSYQVDAQLLDAFIRNDLIVDSIRGLEGKIRFFESAARKRPDDPYVLQHYARMLLREQRPELALAQIDRALAMNEGVRVLHHTRGLVLAGMATTLESVELARRRLAQAEAAFRRSIAMNQRDPYPYQSLAELYLSWARRISDEAERVAYFTKAEEVISEGLPKVWDREGLWIISSQIQRWLGNQPESTSALERAVAETPGSIVARYILGVRYVEGGRAERALEVLQPLVAGNPNEFRPCIAYARAQVEAGDGYPAGIATLRLGELFGLQDARFIATLGGMQFMNGDFSDAAATFRRSAAREFSLDEQNSVHFRPPMNPGTMERLRLEGKVLVVRGAYAFIQTSGYERVFYPGSKLKGIPLEAGMAVSYEVGFTARGPVALNLEHLDVRVSNSGG